MTTGHEETLPEVDELRTRIAELEAHQDELLKTVVKLTSACQNQRRELHEMNKLRRDTNRTAAELVAAKGVLAVVESYVNSWTKAQNMTSDRAIRDMRDALLPVKWSTASVHMGVEHAGLKAAFSSAKALIEKWEDEAEGLRLSELPSVSAAYAFVLEDFATQLREALSGKR